MYFISALLLILTHFYGLLVLLLQIGFFIIIFCSRYLPVSRTLWQGLAGYLGLAIVYWSLWGHNLMVQYQSNKFAWIKRPKNNPLLAFIDTVVSPNFNLGHQISQAFSWLLLLGFICYLVGISFSRQPRSRSAIRAALASGLVFGWLFLPFIVAYGQSIMGRAPSLMSRTMIIVSPALFLAILLSGEKFVWPWIPKLIGLFTKNILRPFSLNKIYLKLSFPISVILASLLFLGATLDYYGQQTKQDIRGTVKSIIEEAPQLYPDPLILCTSGFAGIGLDYYFKRYRSRLRYQGELNDSNYLSALDKHKERLVKHRYLVLVVLHRHDCNRIIAHLKTQASVKFQRKLHHARYIVFDMHDASLY